MQAPRSATSRAVTASGEQEIRTGAKGANAWIFDAGAARRQTDQGRRPRDAGPGLKIFRNFATSSAGVR
jgi:hypothetical protein